MRVVVVSHHLPPRGTAGVEIYSARLASALASGGHETLLYATDDDPALERGTTRSRTIDGVQTRETAEPRRVDRPDDSWSNPSVERAFAEVLAEFRPDVVHFQNARFLGFGVVEVARRHGAGVVFTLNDHWLVCARDGLLLDRDDKRCVGPDVDRCADCLRGFRFGLTPAEAKARRLISAARGIFGEAGAAAARRVAVWLRRRSREESREDLRSLVLRRNDARRRLVDATDFFLAPSRFEAEAHRSAGIPSSKLRQTGYGIDVEAPPPSPGAEDGPLRIGYFGTVAPHKGPHVLIEAMEHLPENFAVVEAYGRDDLRPEYAAPLKRRARGLPVRFHGAYAPEDAGALMSRCDVVVVPSRWPENAPFTVREAQASGVPVVAASVGGLPELVRDGVDGDLFPPDDARALAAVLLRLGSDRGLLASRRAAAPEVRSMSEHVAELSAIYREAAKAAEGRSP